MKSSASKEHKPHSIPVLIQEIRDGLNFKPGNRASLALDSLEEQLGAKQRELDEEIERAVENGRLAKRLHEQFETLRDELHEIGQMEWHECGNVHGRACVGVRTAARRARAVLDSIPASSPKWPAFENHEELPLVDVEPIDEPDPAKRRESIATQLARDIAYGVGDDRDGWYGAAEARALADEVLRLALDISGESSTSASEMLSLPEETTCGKCGLITTGRVRGCPRDDCPCVSNTDKEPS